MSEKQKAISRIKFNKGITSKELENIPKDFKGQIIVCGNIDCSEESIVINGDLKCIGDVRALNITVNGKFTVNGYTKIKNAISVKGDCILYGDLYAESITVEGNLTAKDIMHCKKVNVSKTFTNENNILDAESITVEEFKSHGNIGPYSHTNPKRANIHVFKNFTSTQLIEANRITVGGNFKDTPGGVVVYDGIYVSKKIILGGDTYPYAGLSLHGSPLKAKSIECKCPLNNASEVMINC